MSERESIDDTLCSRYTSSKTDTLWTWYNFSTWVYTQWVLLIVIWIHKQGDELQGMMHKVCV